jgi:hypothetical protein
MFKKIFVGLLLTILVAAAATGIYQYSQTASAQAGTTQPGTGTTANLTAQSSGQGYRGGQANTTEDLTGQNEIQPQAQSQAQLQEHVIPTGGELSSAEAADLVYMLEEEKLARDVYTALYSTWGLPVFQNIAASEQAHMDAVQSLVDGYGLEVPSLEVAGTFNNLDLQKLYTDLIARGSQSIAEAIQVGGAIEEIDILDLQKSLAETDNADIQQVFNNLLRGSENHLRAFANNLMTQTGETYAPQYMTAEQYQALVSAAGNGNGAGGFGQQGGQGGQNGRGGRGGQGGQGIGGSQP